MSEMRIVRESLSGCIGSAGAADRYYVIAEPIDETGVCFQFDSEVATQAFMDQAKAKAGLKEENHV